MSSYSAIVSGCFGKRRWESFALARERAEKRSDGRRPRVAYRCRFCGGVHIGERDVGRERADRRLRREVEREAQDAALD